MNDHPYSSLPLLLVSGLGRSGTTVMRQCINAHPEIDCLNQESNYIFAVMRHACLLQAGKEYPTFPPVSEPRFWHCHQQMLLHLLWPAESAGNPPPGKALSTYSMLGPGAAFALNKTFPTVSILFMVRNGIEVVSSYRSFEGFKDLSFEKCCQLWRSSCNTIQHAETQEHMNVIRYEWLHDDRNKLISALSKAMQQVGIEFDSVCLEPLDQKRIHPTRYEGESRKAAKDPSKRKDRWMFWSAEQREQFESICGESMNQLGYPIPWCE